MFSDDEVFIGLGSIALAVVVSAPTFATSVSVIANPHRPIRRERAYLGPVLAIAGLALVLARFASSDVVTAPEYIGFYLVLGLAWLGVFHRIPIGLSLRDDVFERANEAALIAWYGMSVGIVACFAGANIGDGPGYFVVLHAAFFAMLGFVASAAVVGRYARLQDKVTIDRDVASGIRLASFFAVSGVFWGRGAAGDFVSYGTTIADFHASWPVLVLLAKVVLVERLVPPTPERPEGDVLTHGALPAIVDVLIVVAGLALVGPPPDPYSLP